MLDEEQNRKRSKGKIYAQWEAGPHAHDGETACALAAGHPARAEGASGAAVNSRASPATNFSPTP